MIISNTTDMALLIEKLIVQVLRHDPDNQAVAIVKTAEDYLVNTGLRFKPVMSKEYVKKKMITRTWKEALQQAENWISNFDEYDEEGWPYEVYSCATNYAYSLSDSDDPLYAAALLYLVAEHEGKIVKDSETLDVWHEGSKKWYRVTTIKEITWDEANP